MKLISWNVNGIRAVIKKGFFEFIQDESPDILCLQEVKARPNQVTLPEDFLSKYGMIWNPAEKAGYSGTAAFFKLKPGDNTCTGIGIPEFDSEGRTITLEFDGFYLVNVYVPNVKPTLARLEARQRWDAALLRHLQELETRKPVILCGDLNVAHMPIDLARPKPNRGKAGYTEEERIGLTRYIDAGFIDTFRHFNDRPHNYSWWSYRGGARARNVGWRIDYFLASQNLVPQLESASILAHVHGSDHCPVSLSIKH